MRPLAYNECDCIIVCFDLTNAETLENAGEKWKAEARKLGPPGVPFVLCGCKSDLERKVSEEECLQAANAGKFASYVECSAKINDNCDTVFQECVKVTHDETFIGSERDPTPRRNEKKDSSVCSCSLF